MNNRNFLLTSIACVGAAVTVAILKAFIGPAADVEPVNVAGVSGPRQPLTETYEHAGSPALESPRAQSPNLMQDALTRMSEMQRKQLFRLAIRDGGFRCNDVIDASSMGNEDRDWRVSCDDTGRYLITVGDLEQLMVQPLAWDDAVF